MVFKFVFKKHGDTVYTRMWVGRSAGELAFAGRLAYTTPEWDTLVRILNRGKIPGTQIILEEQVTSGPATRGNNDCHPPLA